MGAVNAAGQRPPTTCKGNLNSLTTWRNHIEVRRLCKNFVLPNGKLREFMNRMSCGIDRGLAAKTHHSATVKCWPTYVQRMPTGRENGRFLALDLGGSNFRVLKLELGPDKCFEMDQNTYKCSETLMKGTGVKLFDYIASCLDEFVATTTEGEEERAGADPLPLGFTFSFPMRQTGVDSGTLVRWTKGFTCDGVVGRDVVELLTRSIGKFPDLNVRVCAILNDTVGTLMSCAWTNPKTRIGLIVGTGFNCCYLEKVKNIGLCDGEFLNGEEMVINLEWGAFGDKGELRGFQTKYDRMVDEGSENRREQMLEKMVSGKYLGELLRLLLLDMIADGLVFDGVCPKMLGSRNAITSEALSLIESDPPETYTATRRFLRQIGVDHPTDGDCMNVRYASECVSKRSAHLVAAGLAVLLNRMNEKDVIVGVDGSVYRYHPFYHQLLTDKIQELVDVGIKFGIMLSEDGSGIGAAVLASSVSQQGE